MTPLRSFAWICLLVAVSLAGCLTGPDDVAATGAMRYERLPTTLPVPGAAVVWTGEAVYLLGGYGDNATAIHRYDPDTGELTRLDVELPGPRQRATAVWSGEHVYVLGGIEGTELAGDIVFEVPATGIVRFDPADRTAEKLDVDAPVGRNPVLAWGGDGIYLIGANSGNASARAIQRWRPGADGFEVLDVRLPFTVHRAEAVWTGEEIFVLGGTGTFPDGTGSRYHDTILAVDPGEATVEVRDAELPWKRQALTQATAAWTGETAVVFPGTARQGWAGAGPIVRYDPSADRLERISDGLPGLRHPALAFARGDTIDVVVEEARCDGHVGEVLRWRPKAPNVTSPTASPTAGFDVEVYGDRIYPDPCASTDPDGLIVAYRWEFGDGSRGRGVDPTHAYDAPGTYNVTLTVVDSDGARDRVTRQVEIRDGPPKINRALEPEPDGAHVTGSVNGSSDVFGRIASYRWEWGDGNVSWGPWARHTYERAGSYTIRVVVTDDDGQTSSESWQVEIVDGDV